MRGGADIEGLDGLLTELAAYVRYVADAFRLRDWEFTVGVDPSLIDSLAVVHFTHRRRVADIVVGDEFFAASPAEQRQAICEKLARAHLEAVRDAVNTVRASLGLGIWELLKANLDGQVEGVANELAAVAGASLLTPEEFVAARPAAPVALPRRARRRAS